MPVEAAYRAPSLYDEALRLLARRSLALPATHTERDWTQPYSPDKGVEAAWLVVYRAPQTHWDLYQLGEELTDLSIPAILDPNGPGGAGDLVGAADFKHVARVLAVFMARPAVIAGIGIPKRPTT